MKRIYLFLLFLIYPFLDVQAQLCNCEARLVPTSINCCYSLQLRFPVTRGCSTSDVRTVIFNTNVVSGFTSEISSVLLSPPGINVAVDPSKQKITFTSPTNIVTDAGLGNWFSLGQICLDNASAGSSAFSITALESDINKPSCENQFELNVPCKKPPSNPVDTTKLYGDSLSNIPTKIKAFGDAYYVTGSRQNNGTEYATMSKFDLFTGGLIWQIELDIPSIITDFEIEPVKKSLILVGRTPITQSPNGLENEYLIVNLDVNGNHISSRRYSDFRIGGFHRIVRQENPKDSSFSYYITGYRTSSPAVSIPDESFLYNVNFLGQVNWIKKYEATNPSQRFEIWRGLYALDNGDVVMTGNDFNQTGILLRADGLTGQEVESHEMGSGLRLTDGVQIPGGIMIIGGEDLSTNEGIFLVLNSLFGYEDAARYPNLGGFYDIGVDKLNRIYTTTKLKNTLDPTYAILRVSYNGPGSVLTNGFLKEIRNSNTDLDIVNGRIWVSPEHDAVFYTDGRNNSVGWGDFDLMLGVYDLDITDDCAFDKIFIRESMPPLNVSININDNDVVEPTFVKLDCNPLNYLCAQFCNVGPPPSCMANFSWTSNCLEVTFTDLSTGTGPFTYEWDINCDNIIESTAQNPTLIFPAAGEYKVCLTITDANGCTDTFSEKVVVKDNNPPILNCSDVVFSTDPGLCEATISIPYSVTDDCDNSPTVICEIDGATIGSTVTLPKGMHKVLCIATDASGNADTCSFKVTIEDLEKPEIICPPNINIDVPACDGGAEVFLMDPVYSDNCPMVSWSSSHQSGSFFPCGSTTVSYTATDMSGNVSTCSFKVNVNCSCGTIDTAFIECTPSKYTYKYSIIVNNLTGASDPDLNCTIDVLSNQANTNVNVTSVNWNGAGTQATVMGMVSNSVAPIPLNLDLFVRLNCICGSGTVSCDLPVSLETPCCDTIRLEDQMVCQTDSAFYVSIIGCDDLDFVDQVNWYVAPAPCPPDSFGLPFKSIPGIGCVDLCLNPSFFSGDVCIYAEVILNDSAGPCRRLLTNVAQITFCEPVNCSIKDQEYCYSGTSIVPTPLMIDLIPSSPKCDYSIQWFDSSGPIPGETGLTYQPPALDFLGDTTDCYYDHVFRAQITDSCGVRECHGIIRLFNNDAPTGELIMDPFEPQPFCPGEDATLRYEPECAGDPPMWDWLISTDGISYSPIPGAGSFNPVYNTNRLFVDTWYAVEIQNGVCPKDRVEYKIKVKDPLTISSFTAEYDDHCDPSIVLMEVNVAPCFSIFGTACDCDYTVEWYKDGVLLSTSDHTTSPATLSYADPDGLDGNYYVVIKDNCCPGQEEKSNVVQLEPVWEPVILGPCFICMSSPSPQVELVGALINPPFASFCAFQWTASGGGNIVSGANSPTVIVDKPGIYTLTVTCGSCVKQTVFELIECITVATYDLENEGVSINIYPNPTSGKLQLSIEELQDIGPYFLQIFDVNDKEIMSKSLGNGELQTSLELSQIPAGVYVLKISNNEGKFTQRMFVKQ